MKFCGIDLSMNSTGICIYDTLNDGYEFFNFYQSLSKKRLNFLQSININFIKLMNSYTGTDEYLKTIRMIDTADIIFNKINDVDFVGIEGFSFAAKSNRLAEIAGLQYLLRERLINANIPFRIYQPTTIKKYAGHGQYNKTEMIDQFLSTNLTIAQQLKSIGEFYNKPIDDLSDAYFICEKLREDFSNNSIAKTISNLI